MEHEPKKRGRPKAEQPSGTVCTWLPVQKHDRLVQMAQDRQVTVSALVRNILVRVVDRTT